MNNRPVAVVTGGLGVLGRAVADILIAADYHVAVIDRVAAGTPDGGKMLDRQAADKLLLANVDLTDLAATETAMRSVVARFSGIDVLVNVAGGFRWELLEQGALDTWDFLYRTNLRTAVVACRAALPFLKQSGNGRIVNIGAGAAAGRAAKGMGAYTASKAGVHKLTESLADELKDAGITVNAILPGTIDTPQNRADMPDADRSRWVTPRDVANVVAFLASANAAAVTGALIPVNGRG